MKPVVVESVEDLRQAVSAAKQQGQSVGLVPTMGALHAGHRSLLEAARVECGFVVCSLFVNPTQFGPHEDYQRYPRTLEHDLEVCEQMRTDLLYLPSVEVMYPPGFRTYTEVTGLQNVLCGASRPGHFRGVATVVLKLFTQVTPTRAYFGQKDAQQVRIIQQLTRDLNLPLEIRVVPTVRESDGLALSSRNQYLDPGQRQQATVLYRALREAQAKIEAGEREGRIIRQLLRDRIGSVPGVELDYAEVVSHETLMPLDRLQGPVLMAVAARLGSTRLIDNILLQLPASV